MYQNTNHFTFNSIFNQNQTHTTLSNFALLCFVFVNPRTKRISRGHWRRKLGGASGLFCGLIVIERVRTLRLKLLTCVLRQILTLLSRGLGFLHWLTGSTSCHIVVFVVDFCQSSVIWLLCVISGKSIRLCRISLILISGLLMLWMLGKWVAFSFLAQMELRFCVPMILFYLLSQLKQEFDVIGSLFLFSPFY